MNINTNGEDFSKDLSDEEGMICENNGFEKNKKNGKTGIPRAP